MRIDVPLGLAINFGLVLCRTAGLMALVPIPGLKSGFELPRLVLAILFAVLLLPWVAQGSSLLSSPATIAFAAFSEAALGIVLGLCVALIGEGLQLAGQMIGLQAGFSYSSTIDPSSDADSAILQVLLNLSSSFLFLAMGLDTVLFRLMLGGTHALPPGRWVLEQGHAGVVLTLLNGVFTEAIRCALPVLGILLIVDMTLALLSRIQPQLQLLSLSFPLKILAAIAVLALSTGMLPGAVERSSARSLSAAWRILQPGGR